MKDNSIYRWISWAEKLPDDWEDKINRQPITGQAIDNNDYVHKNDRLEVDGIFPIQWINYEDLEWLCKVEADNQDENFELIKGCVNRLNDLLPFHIAPYNLGDSEKLKTSYKHYSPSSLKKHSMSKQEKRGVYMVLMIVWCAMIFIFKPPIVKWSIVGAMVITYIGYRLDKNAA